jgi:dTDP-4-amino-4,6-dideoxygalactose transaminase
MTREKIQLLIPDMPDADALRPWLQRIDAARWYTNFGPLVTELESKLAARFPRGTQVVTVNSATMGLELALIALDLPPGARVLLPGLTFAASAAAVLRAGGVPVFADVDPDSWLLTPAIAERVAAEMRLGAVMPVSTYGAPQDSAEWDAFVARTTLPVVMDAAAAFDTQQVGARFTAVFSLHATKVLGAGEGGFVASTDAAFLDRVRKLSNFGIDVSTGSVETAGANGKLSEYHAAAALAALERWPERREVRLRLHLSCLQELQHACPEVRPQLRPADRAYSIFPVLLPEGHSAPNVQRRLAAEAIESRRWYCPTLDRHPAFSAMERAGTLHQCQAATARLLALPFHPFLDSADVHRICTTLARLVA